MEPELPDVPSQQKHLLSHWDSLSSEEKWTLCQDIQSVNFSDLEQAFELTKQGNRSVESILKPPAADVCGSSKDTAACERYRKIAFDAIKAGKVAVLLLAGGQGTRLGVSHPKGMYDVNLPSRKSLYQLQAERLLKLCATVTQELSGEARIPWYIMTSEHTKKETQHFFETHQFFGYNPADVIFFEQYTLPSLSFDGKVLLRSRDRLFRAPDGNGGLYRALRGRGMLEDMKTRGISSVQIYCVDNILVRMADPFFIGYCLSQNADCGAKVVSKTNPHEPIGVLGLVDGRYQVVEYSEISKETAELRAPASGDCASERLLYSHGNICIHYMTVDFLRHVSEPDNERQIHYHVARKKVPNYDPQTALLTNPSTPNGIKLEKFIFDVFKFANHFVIWEVDRRDEFAPLKNAPGASSDCPKTCREAVLNMHARWLQTTTKALTGKAQDFFVEISPLVSLFGENLELLAGEELHGHSIVEQDHESGKPVLLSAGNWKPCDA